MQCPECGLPRPAGADPCPSCGADAPAPSGGTRAGGGTSLRQWKERYHTGQLPGLSTGQAGPRVTRQFNQRASGSLGPTTGQFNPDWGSESPSSSIPPSGGLSSRRSGMLGGSPSASIPPTRRSGGLSGGFSSTPSWPRTPDATPPPPTGRNSGILSNPARTGGTEPGNGSNSWKWQQPSRSGSGAGLARQTGAEAYDDQGDYALDEPEAPTQQPSGSFRRSSMLPVPYQQDRRGRNQGGYEMDEEGGSSPNLPAPLDMSQGSSAFPMLSEEALARRIPPGRKAPAFIPATRPRRPYRLSNYRIISGTISLIVMTVLVAGALGFLGIRSGLVSKAFGSKPLPPISYHFPQPTMPTLGTTPQATPSSNQAAKIIMRVTTAAAYTKSYDPLNVTTTFKPGETVNVCWQVKGIKANDVVSVKWYQNGIPIPNLDKKNTQQPFLKDGDYNGVFGLSYPSPSLGTAELYYNGQLGWTIQFIITN